MDIMGFKSFPDRVQVFFAPGISAVVGPNGCGKSNIVDAIRWVMGEQSAKQLRGRNMEDVLFSGSNGHQASGLAEVTMTLCHDNGRSAGTHLGPSEIAVTRRLYRSGDSEYLINKIPCRLKDVLQFFMDTGMGTKAYSVIEQGRIGAMVDARPEERRALIDEAAGITRYKAQKKEAERKIEATEQNLVHINTLMAETKRQINNLTRAARKAAQYKELKAALQEVDVALAAQDMAALKTQQAVLSTEQEDLRLRLGGVLNDLERMDLDLQATRIEIVEQEKEAEAKTAALYNLHNEFNRLRQQEEFLRGRQEDCRVRGERLGRELDHLKQQRAKHELELARLKEEKQGLETEAEEKRRTLEELHRGFNQLKNEYQAVVGRRDQWARDLADIRRRLSRLEENLAGHARMARSQMIRREEIIGEIEELRAEVARLDHQEAGIDQEKETLAGKVEAARREAQARKLELEGQRAEAERLKEEERGIESKLAGLTSRLATLKDIQAKFGWYPEGVRALMAASEKDRTGVLGPVAERITAPEGYEAALEAALGERLNYVLVVDRASAVRALNYLKGKKLGRCGFIVLEALGPEAEKDLARTLLGDYVPVDNLAEALDRGLNRPVLTKEGDYCGPGGLIVGGGGGDKDKGLLARKREMERLAEQVNKLETEKKNLADRRAAVLAQAEDLEGTLVQTEQAARRLEADLVELDKRLSVVGARRQEIDGRLNGLSRTLKTQTAEAERLAAEKEAAQAEMQALQDEEFDLNREYEQVLETVQTLAAEVEAARTREQEASLAASSLLERLKTAEREVGRTLEWLKETEARIKTAELEWAECRREEERLIEQRRETAAQTAGFDQRLAQAEEETAAGKRRVDELRSKQNTQENQARQARREREALEEKRRKVELDIQEINFKKQALAERIENEYHLDLNRRLEEDPGPAEDFDPDQARARRDELRGKIETLGEVNLTAITEHEALKERYEFYHNQYQDLTASIENLKQSIARINRTCKIRFTNTFKAVDEKLREIFPLLFEGGEAWLSLTDENQILDSGVEIHVHPPGKRLTVMSLLSGGEKALVALAFIFALYLIKPSPFCLLDEIDAPLDEANIDRFNKLLTKLGQSSQIIMVTHNKRTMQIAQTLYGVTMEQPGVSKMVSVNLADIEVRDGNVQMVQAG